MILPAVGGALRGTGGAALCFSYSFWMASRSAAGSTNGQARRFHTPPGKLCRAITQARLTDTWLA